MSDEPDRPAGPAAPDEPETTSEAPVPSDDTVVEPVVPGEDPVVADEPVVGAEPVFGVAEPVVGEEEPVVGAEPVFGDDEPVVGDEPVFADEPVVGAEPVGGEDAAGGADPAGASGPVGRGADEPLGTGGDGPEAVVAAGAGDGPRGAAARAEQIEWQPVATGDHVEWQPVVSAEDRPWSEDEAPAEEWHEPVSYEDYEDYEDGGAEESWDPDPGPAAAGNGAAGRYAPGRGAHPASRRPPAHRPAATRARPPASRRTEALDERDDEDQGLPAKTKRQVIILSVLTVLVVGVGIAGFLLSRDASKTGEEAIDGGGTPTSAPSGPTIPATEMQAVHDPLTNFNIKVPKAWQNHRPLVADVRLVMAAGENDGLSVRILPIEVPATVDNIGNFKEVTDTIVFGDASAKLLQEQLIRVNNNLAYHYIYTFTDKTTGQEGVHAHYFIFEGNRMFSVVFQTIPAQDFVRLAPIFDQVAESITIGPAPAPSTTTTTP